MVATEYFHGEVGNNGLQAVPQGDVFGTGDRSKMDVGGRAC